MNRMESIIQTLSKSLEKFQKRELERTGLIADGMYLRDGWISSELPGCGKYSKDEWSCRIQIRDSDLFWDVGCIKDTDKCISGKAVAVTSIRGNNAYSLREPQNKGCIRYWIMWECGNLPPTDDEAYYYFKTGKKHHVWAKSMMEKQKNLYSR